MIIPIGKFDGGIITNADPEDISNTACINMLNLKTDISGRLVKQDGHALVKDLTASNGGNPFNIERAIQWMHPKLENGYGWIIYEKINKKLFFADHDFANISTLKTFTGTQPDDIRIEQVGEEVRVAMGLNEDSQIIQFLKDRKFFNGTYDPYSSANTDDDYVVIDRQEPSYPSTWSYTVSAIDDNNETLDHAKYHYYKAVPVFDGNQEYKFEDNKNDVSLQNFGANKSLKFILSLDTDDMNKRMTGVNIYRAITTNATDTKSFYKVASSTLNTKQSNTHQETVATVTPCHRRFYLQNNDITNESNFNDEMNKNFNSYPPTIYVYNSDSSQFATIALSEISGTPEVNADFLGTDSNNSNKQYFKTIEHTNVVVGKNWNIYYDKANENESQNLGWYFNTGGGGHAGSKTGGYGGKRVFYKNNAFTQYAEYDGYLLKKADDSLNIIKESDANGLGLSVDAGSDNTAVSIDVIFASTYAKYNASNGETTLTLIDNGLIDQSPHPINETKLGLRHITSEDVGARRFYGNVRLDPDTDAEDHSNFLVYSDLNQPDIHPISNYIQVKDRQGGGIVALKRIGDSLAVLMENGLYQLYIPSNDPKMWSLVESEENIGCVAPYSVVRTKTSLFFAGEHNIYQLTNDWQLVAIGEPIKDIWQGFTSDQRKACTFTYNPKRNSLSCLFSLLGSPVANSGIWEYNLDTATWAKFNNSFTTGHTGKFIFTDKDTNINVFVSNADVSQSSIVKLDQSSSSESLQTTRTTGWINVSSLSDQYNVQLRRFNLSYDSGDTITATFYKDGDSSTAVYEDSSTFTSSKKQAEIKVPVRCNQIMVKLSTSASTNDVKINRMEIEADA
tara:strand:- start:3728 stop:6268 length:2541 start_codon:yes stop_codon:yes gene_type:complete